MKNLFKSVSVNENFAGFVWQEKTEYTYDESDTYLVEKEQDLIQGEFVDKADLTDYNDANEIRKNKIDNRIKDFIANNKETLDELTDTEYKEIFKLTSYLIPGYNHKQEIIDKNQDGYLNSSEFEKYLTGVNVKLNSFLVKRKIEAKEKLEKENKFEAASKYNKFREELVGKYGENAIKNLENKISTGDKIYWEDKETFKANNFEIKSSDEFFDNSIYKFPNYNDLNPSAKKKVGVMLKLLTVDLNKNKKILENAIKYKVLRGEDAKDAVETDKKENSAKKTKTTETKEKSENLLDKLNKEDISDFVEGFKDGKINWRKGNEKLAELLKIKNTTEAITKLQNELGIYGSAADGMAGTQTFARLYSKKGWKKPKTFDNPGTEQYLASWESKIDVSGEDIDEKAGIINKIKTSLGKLNIKNDFELGDPKKINGIIKTPLIIKEGENKGTYIAVKSGDSYEFKESWGKNSYVDKIFSNKKIEKVEKNSA